VTDFDESRPEIEGARLAELLTAEQDERRRLALFLHDGPVQILSGVALMLDAVGHAIEDGRLDDAERILREALGRHRDVIRSLRDLSFNLEPVVLRDRGIASAVAALAQDVGIANEIQFELDLAAANELEEKVQAAVYQIVRDALNSAVRRRPPPTKISITVTRGAEGHFVATISDDGAQERRRAFFDVLRERARTLDSQILFELGAGKTVGRELPAAAAAAVAE
jgi:two-component system, NarL family, sensor kinase